MYAGAAVMPKVLDAQSSNQDFNAGEAVLSVAIGIGQAAMQAASFLKSAEKSLRQGAQQVLQPAQQAHAQVGREPALCGSHAFFGMQGNCIRGCPLHNAR